MRLDAELVTALDLLDFSISVYTRRISPVIDLGTELPLQISFSVLTNLNNYCLATFKPS